MIIDITGIVLTPGNLGKDCLGNGIHHNEKGELIECCCDECDYMQCCLNYDETSNCNNCSDMFCPRALNNKADTSK